MSGEAENISTDSATVPTPSTRAVPAARLEGAIAIGAVAVGALALGALAVGAVAIGKLAIGQLSLGRARLRRGRVDDLYVGSRSLNYASNRGRSDGNRCNPLTEPRCLRAGTVDALQRWLAPRRQKFWPDQCSAPPVRLAGPAMRCPFP
jgi:hypothetical protein